MAKWLKICIENRQSTFHGVLTLQIATLANKEKLQSATAVASCNTQKQTTLFM
jgi:hypothetical protein